MDERIWENFKQAIDILRNKVTQAEFDMAWWRSNSQEEPALFFTPKDCGTVGCALGQLPVKGTGDLAPTARDYGEDQTLRWHAYMRRVFGESSQNAFSFLFAPGWAAFDNTPEGAAARMEYYLNNQEEINCGDWEYSSFETGWAD